MLFFDMDLARNGECVGAANSTFLCAQQYDILPDMKPKDHYNVLAVYSLRDFAGREHFSGVLDEMSNTRNWHLTNIRPKLRLMNKQLRALALAVKYTTFLDVWNEITDRASAYEGVDKRAIIERCMRDWKNNANK